MLQLGWQQRLYALINRDLQNYEYRYSFLQLQLQRRHAHSLSLCQLCCLLLLLLLLQFKSQNPILFLLLSLSFTLILPPQRVYELFFAYFWVVSLCVCSPALLVVNSMTKPPFSLCSNESWTIHLIFILSSHGIYLSNVSKQQLSASLVLFTGKPAAFRDTLPLLSSFIFVHLFIILSLLITNYYYIITIYTSFEIRVLSNKYLYLVNLLFFI